MNTVKRWNIAILLASLVIPAAVAGVNYFMDPLWCFSLSHKYNQFQHPFNERIQKTNYITFRDKRYQGVLIGTSRSTCINQHVFAGVDVFNYSCNGLSLSDYADYIQYIKKRNGASVRHIFIGLDFSQAMVRGETNPLMGQADNSDSVEPRLIISRANNPLYRIKTLISIDTLKYSEKNFNNYRYGAAYYYTRDNVKMHKHYSRTELDGIVKLYLDHFDKTVYPKYTVNGYNEGFRDILRKIRDDNRGAIITVYTTPICDPLMKLFMKHGLFRYYVRWMTDILDVFGGFYHFMYPSMVTRNYHDYFHDAVHSNPEVGDMIVDVIYNKKNDPGLDFGMYVDKRNFPERLKYLENLCSKL